MKNEPLARQTYQMHEGKEREMFFIGIAVLIDLGLVKLLLFP